MTGGSQLLHKPKIKPKADKPCKAALGVQKSAPIFSEKRKPLLHRSRGQIDKPDFVNWWARYRVENDRSHLKTPQKYGKSA